MIIFIKRLLTFWPIRPEWVTGMKTQKQLSGNDNLILAVDLGTSGCKSAVCTLDGRILSWAYREVELMILPGHGAEQRPEDWWTALLETSRTALNASGVDRSKVRGICCSTQGEVTVPVDEQGQELMNAVLWMDMRGAEHIQNHAGGPVAGYSPRKLWKWIRLTGGAPSLSGKDPAAHMLLIKNEFPEVYERTYKFLNALDYLNMKLTGKFVATPDSILTSWVTDNRDSNRVRYDSSLLTLSGIDPKKFPEIVRCTDIIGGLLPEVASALKLPSGTPVIGGAIDVSAAAIGSGAVVDGEAHLYIGTSSWIAAHVPNKKTDIISSMASVPCAIPGKYLMTAMQTTAGANLSFLKDRILYHQDELLREEHVSDVYKILDRIAARTPAGSRGLLYMPWLYGERCPVDDLSLRGGMVNLSLEHSREDIIRAFLEGVALNTRWMLKPVEKFLKKNLSSITIVGGGATSDVWCQIFADTLGIPVRQPEATVQSNARGSAWIAGIGLGLLKFSDIPELIRIKAEYQPDQKNKKAMDEMFARFMQLHDALGPLYKSWNREKTLIVHGKKTA